MRTEDGLSPEIHIKRGVRQGCVLSPCLFNLYTENIFGAVYTNKVIKIGGTTINNLRYADDTVLLAETGRSARHIEWSEPHWENVRYENECKEDYQCSGLGSNTRLLSKRTRLFSGQVKCLYMVIRRTSQFFYCNLKFGFLKSRKETAGSVARSMQTQKKTMCLLLASRSLSRGRRFWAIINGFFRVGMPGFKSASFPWANAVQIGHVSQG